MGNIIRKGDFRDKSNVVMVKGFKEKTWVTESMHSVEDTSPDSAPIFLEEESKDAVWTKSFMRA